MAITDLKYKTIGEYVDFLALSNNIGKIKGKDFFSYVGVENIPQSIEEARDYSNFWNPIISEFKKDVENIEFFYQEKDKELPLSFVNNVLNKIGFKINPKIQEGELKYDKVTPELIRNVDSSKSLVNIIAKKDEWKRLNDLAKESHGFSAPYVMLPENLCYQVNIPLECISGVKFNSTEFLNKEYKEKENVSQTRINQ